MQIELSPESERVLKELIAARKRQIPDYKPSMTVIGNAMIQTAATEEIERRKPILESFKPHSHFKGKMKSAKYNDTH